MAEDHPPVGPRPCQRRVGASASAHGVVKPAAACILRRIDEEEAREER